MASKTKSTKLNLNRETVRALDGDKLAQVAGGGTFRCAPTFDRLCTSAKVCTASGCYSGLC